MGNLGAYQTMTTLAKKVGGPAKLAAVVAVAGWAALRGVEAGGKVVAKFTKGVLEKRNAPCPAKGQVFDVRSEGADAQGLALHPGDQYRVLEGDGDAILIEVLGGSDNPYFVSAQFLTTVSDFPTTAADADG